MNRFFHVGFAFSGVPKVRDLEPVFTQMNGDWIRYSKLGWVAWTNLTPQQILQRLQPHLDTADQVLIAPIVLEESWGILAPWMWTWINSKIPGSGVVFGEDLRAHIFQALNKS